MEKASLCAFGWVNSWVRDLSVRAWLGIGENSSVILSRRKFQTGNECAYEITRGIGGGGTGWPSRYQKDNPHQLGREPWLQHSGEVGEPGGCLGCYWSWSHVTLVASLASGCYHLRSWLTNTTSTKTRGQEAGPIIVGSGAMIVW